LGSYPKAAAFDSITCAALRSHSCANGHTFYTGGHDDTPSEAFGRNVRTLPSSGRFSHLNRPF
jgi:hypothetical protein